MITTFDELKAKISSQIDRSDLTDDVVSDFITLCETAMKRDLHTMGAEGVSTFTTAPGVDRVPLPADYIGIRSISIQGDPNQSLRMVTVEKLNASYGSNTQGLPVMFTISSNYFILSPAPDGEYTLELDYYKFIPLSDENTSNWILEKHPDLYLTGSLFEAGDWTMDDTKLAKYKARYDSIISDINERDKAERYGADLRSRPYGMNVV